MTLGQLIAELEKLNPGAVVAHGFSNPHSYRGYYDELAFEPTSGVTIGAMLDDARSAVGATYTGWKGGDFTMNDYTDVWLAHEGSTGEAITSHYLLVLRGEGA